MDRNEAERIFNAVGGTKKLIAWARLNSANYAVLIQMLGKSVLGGVSDTPHAASESIEEIYAAIEQTLIGVVKAHASGDKPAASVTMIDDSGVRVVVRSAANPHVANRPGRDGNSNTAAHRIEEVPARVAQLDSPVKPKPVDVKSRRDKPESIPGLCAAAVLEGSQSGQPSATELFYSWSGHARPSWSPPRDWSGS